MSLAQTPKEPIVEFFSLDSNPLTAIGLATNDAATYNYITYGPVMMDWYNEALKSSKAPGKSLSPTIRMCLMVCMAMPANTMALVL